jgi:hypothetical protein
MSSSLLMQNPPLYYTRPQEKSNILSSGNTDGTIRLRATPFGIHRPKALALSPHLGNLWIIENTNLNPYFLSGTFTISPPEEHTPPGAEHVWRGKIVLSAVRIVNPRPVLSTRAGQ